MWPFPWWFLLPLAGWMNIGSVQVENMSGGTVNVGPLVSLGSGPVAPSKENKLISLLGDSPVVRVGTGILVSGKGAGQKPTQRLAATDPHRVEPFRTRPQSQATFRTGQEHVRMGGNQRWSASAKR
ncbi:MAG: hypothetical protein ACOY94_13410 [Bacillota bacterium]